MTLYRINPREYNPRLSFYISVPASSDIGVIWSEAYENSLSEDPVYQAVDGIKVLRLESPVNFNVSRPEAELVGRNRRNLIGPERIPDF